MTRNVKAYGQLRDIRRVWSVTFDNYTRKFMGWLSNIRTLLYIYATVIGECEEQPQKLIHYDANQ